MDIRVAGPVFRDFHLDRAGGLGGQPHTEPAEGRHHERVVVVFGNGANYDNFPALPLNSAAQINTATGGFGNVVADPLFEQWGFRWRNGIDFGEPGDFFLTQSGGTISPAVDLCPAAFTLEDNDLDGLSTRTDYSPDTDPPDASFHYSP